ncbi:MmgE/PrpD family protein [Corynebacterium faecale]|uniref:MmgE/PrpD family protein n=1 Tax=Corynebacterium faecale TaxID=1758466 RepID=UPI0025B6038A|nr:MmgE/PrpD family protein [Corynebacterium faecale]WJY91671.1 MmgE/PrpD family protein [Corynebacterium faecale]
MNPKNHAIQAPETQTFAQQIGAFVSQRHQLSADYEGWMRLLHADYAAVTLGGLDRESAEVVRRAVPTWDEASPAAPSRVVSAPGRETFATPEHAALVNGTIAHGLELDDTFEESSLHPAVVVFPALFAVSEEEGSSYGDLLAAAAVGYEVMCRVGVLLGAAESYGRGFHPTGVAGALGSAAAVANLLRLDATQSTNAISIAANITAGSLEFLSDGSWTKRLNSGNAAAAGIRAARLAQAGFTAPLTSIEGRDGFLTQYGRGLVEGRGLNLIAGSAAWDTSIKFYPCCRYMHGGIDLLREIRAENPELDITKVDRIDVAVISAGASLVSLPRERKNTVTSAVDAQFNMPFGAALALKTGEATVADFDNAPEIANELSDLIPKVNCYTDEAIEAAFPAAWQARVKVVLEDGTEFEKFEDAFVGSSGKRATWEQIENKAAGLVGPEMARALLAHVSDLALDDAAVLAAADVPSRV